MRECNFFTPFEFTFEFDIKSIFIMYIGEHFRHQFYNEKFLLLHTKIVFHPNMWNFTSLFEFFTCIYG